MVEDKIEQMKEYLRLKEIQENDKSDEMIEEIYNDVMAEEIV